MNSAKFLKYHKFFDLETYYVKFKNTNINFIKVNCENTTSSFKKQIMFECTEGNVCNDEKSSTAKLNCSTF